MKRLFARILIPAVLLSAAAADAQNTQLPPVTVDAMPTTVAQFTALRDRIATTPEGGAASFIIALNMYAVNPEEGLKALIVAAELSRLNRSTAPNSYSGFALLAGDLDLIRRQIGRATYIPRSYFAGATPQNGYNVDAPYTLNFQTNRYSGDPAGGKVKVFVACGGADSPRPITVIRNQNGIWKAKEWSSVLVGIRAPVEAPPSDEL